MKKPTAVTFESVQKSEVEAWLTLESNLTSVISTLNRILEIISKRTGREILHPDGMLVAPLFVYAVTWYLRCFSTGRRVRLSIGDVPRLSKTDRRIHESVRVLRNHHFAHRVTDQHEGTHVYLILGSDDKTPVAFTSLYVSLVSDSAPDVRHFCRLSEKVLQHVQKKTREVADPFAKTFFGRDATWDSVTIPFPKKL